MSRSSRASSAAVEIREALDGLISALGSQASDPARAAACRKLSDVLSRREAHGAIARTDEAQLRALARFLSGRDWNARSYAMTALLQLLRRSCGPCALLVAEADGAAAALCAMMQQIDPDFAVAAAMLTSAILLDNAALAALLRAAPDLPAAAVAALCEAVPADAAREAGLPVDVDGGPRTRLSPRNAHCLLWSTLFILKRAIPLLRSGTDAARAARAALPATLVPALVAAMAAPDADDAALATQALMWAVTKLQCPEHARQCFSLGPRGLIRGLQRLLTDDVRRAERGRVGDCCVDGIDSLAPALVLAFANSNTALPYKVLTSPAGAAWAAAAPQLLQMLGRLRAARRGAPEAHLYEGVETAVGEFVSLRDISLRMCLEAGTLAPAPPVATSTATAAGVCACVARRCAACGATRADGARLRRCRGCGGVTGVMYCGEACAREDWVKRGHRALCDKGAEAVALMARETEGRSGEVAAMIRLGAAALGRP